MNSYLKIFFGISIISPLVFAFWSLDFDNWSAFWITFIMYVILYSLAVLIFNYLETGYPFQFEPSNKWELVERNKKMVEGSTCPYSLDFRKRTVMVDIYRRRKRNRLYKYKTIKHY